MQQTNTMSLRRQNFMLAIRREMGWPAFKPANDCLAFCWGRVMDLETGSEMARIAQMLGKDAVYTGWKNAVAPAPAEFTIVYRDLLAVDVVDRVVPYAANDRAPIAFVAVRNDETFVVDRRGSLVRLPGKPNDIGKGRARAMQRIKATAATLDDTLLDGNRYVPWGAETVAPEAPAETIVRFG